MASRVLTFNQRPWNGGINTSVDAALLDPNELVRGENIVFDTNGSRKSRDGLVLWDYIATSVSRISSGTTRTLVVSVNSGFTFAVNDDISVRSASAYNSDYDVKKARVISVDAVTYSPNVAITYELSDSLTETITADTDIRIGRWETSDRIIGIYDYWYYSSGSKLQKIVAVSSQGNFYEYSTSGSKSIISTGTLTLNTPLSDCSFATLANKLVISFKGDNAPVIWDASNPIDHIDNTDWEGNDIQSTNPTPKLDYMQLHNQRIYATVFGEPDRIYYSDINNPERWSGEGDSGAVEVAVGDGDSTGFSTIFPSFKGILGVAKGNKLYRINGFAPLQTVELISEGIGSAAPSGAVAVDQDDVVFISRRGFHSFAATDQYGDFAGAYLSAAIQDQFNDLDLGSLSTYKGEYLPNLNSILFAVKQSGQTTNNVCYLYNIQGKQWYKWTQNDAEFQVDSVSFFELNNKRQIVMGLLNGRILISDPDFDKDFVNENIQYRVDTGIIYPDNDPTKIKGFKEVGVLYKTFRDSVDFDVEVIVDDYTPQRVDITQSPEGDLLGSTFFLGSSELGFQEILLPFNQSIDGYGFGIRISITSQNPLEIYGYSINFEPAGDQRQVDR